MRVIGSDASSAELHLDGQRAALMLLVVLSAIGGSMDVISYLSLNGLFTNAVTGNLVLLCAHAVEGGKAQISRLLAVPVFVASILASALLSGILRSIGVATLRPLLLLHLLLLSAFLGLCLAAGPHLDFAAANVIVAAMVGVSAMAVQDTIVHVSFAGMPMTAVMTGNVSRFAVDVSAILEGGDPTEGTKAHQRTARTLPVILAVGVGCAIGAACQAAVACGPSHSLSASPCWR